MEENIEYMVWDGKNLAIIQTITAEIPRRHGRPAAEVDDEWNLKVLDVLVPLGGHVSEDGQVSLVHVWGWWW